MRGKRNCRCESCRLQRLAERRENDVRDVREFLLTPANLKFIAGRRALRAHRRLFPKKTVRLSWVM